MVYYDRNTGYRILQMADNDMFIVTRPDGSTVDEVYSYQEAEVAATQDALDRGEIEYEPDDDADYAQRVGRTMFDRFTSKLGTQGAYEEDPYYINRNLSQE